MRQKTALPKWGQYAMGLVYASIPMAGSYYIYLYVCEKRIENLGKENEKLSNALLLDQSGSSNTHHVGDTILVNGEAQRIGAGGKLGGVRLTVSDVQDQKRNKEMLQAYLKQQQRRKLRKEQKLATTVHSDTP